MSDLTCTNCGEYVGSPIADRIEELEAKAMKASYAAFLEKRRADEAQDKLARALRALERVELSTDTRKQGGIAMATLATKEEWAERALRAEAKLEETQKRMRFAAECLLTLGAYIKGETPYTVATLGKGEDTLSIRFKGGEDRG
jgi:hypothetical protein